MTFPTHEQLSCNFPALKTAVATALVCLAGISGAAFAGPLSFSDTLRAGDPTSGYLSVPVGQYTYTSSGLERTGSSSGSGNGVDRPMVRTTSGGFLNENFVAQITVTTTSSNQDIIFFGLGQALTNAAYNNEPTNNPLFRIHNLPGYQGVQVDVENGSVPYPYTFLSGDVGTYNPAGTKFGISRIGDSLTFSVSGQAVETLSLSQYASYLDLTNAYLFFGNSANGTTFSDFSVTETISTNLQPSSSTVPEPGGLALLGLGISLLASFRRRRRTAP